MMAQQQICDDSRIEKILDLVHSLAAGDLNARCPLMKDGGELDAIIGGLNMLAEELQAAAEERRITMEKLETEKENFKALLEQLPYGILNFDSQGDLHFINDRFVEMFGHSTQSIPDIEAWLRLGFPDDAAHHQFLSYWMDSIKNPEAKHPEPRVFNIICKDGAIKEVLISHIKLEKGNSLAIYDDVTEKRKLEKRLIQAQKLEAVSNLAGGVAHDLNNILSGIVSYPELLLVTLPEDSDLRGPLKTIHSSGIKASAIVQDLLTMTRKDHSEIKVLNLSLVLAEYLQSSEHRKMLSNHPRVTVATEEEPHLLNISGSFIQMTKAIINTVFNAAEAMPDGGTITITLHNEYVSRPIKQYDYISEGEYVVISIADEGLGMNPEERSHIFDPFFTTKKMGRGGTGLGMAIVYSIVKEHNGCIDVAGAADKGTTINIFIPATRDDLAFVEKSKTPISDFKGNNETILIVDDIAEQREICSAIVKRLGYSPVVLPSGEKALEYLRHQTVDLIILDMIMDPGIDGLETYRKIRGINPNQKAIIASGYAESARINEAIALGVGQHIRKPYSIENLGRAIIEQIRPKS